MIEGRTVLAWVGIGVLAAAVPAGALDLFVDGSAGSDANDGLSWATAKASVGAAVALAGTNPGPHTISVAAGVYGETVVVPPDTALLGGFPPGGGARDPAANGTVLDGGRRGPVVLLGPGTDASRLDGFVVRGGRAAEYLEAGGITLSGSAAVVADCLVEGNEGCYGGGLFVDARGLTGPLPLIRDTTIRGNRTVPCGFQAGGGGAFVLTDYGADTSTPILRDCLIEGNRDDWPPDPNGYVTLSSGLLVEGSVRLEGMRFLRNIEAGAAVGAAKVVTCVNCEFRDNRTWGSVLWCPVQFLCENCTWAGNRVGAMSARPLSPIEYALDVVVRRSVLWGNGPEDISPVCDPTTRTVEDSIVEGGFPGGTNVLDADPLFASGPAGDSYLGQTAAGQPQDSPALDAGPVLAADVGLDALTTRTDSVTDAGLVDWGVHYPVFPQLTVLRSADPAALAPHATLQNLPFTDGPGVLDDPLLPLLFYRVEPADNPLRIEKDLSARTLRLAF